MSDLLLNQNVVEAARELGITMAEVQAAADGDNKVLKRIEAAVSHSNSPTGGVARGDVVLEAIGKARQQGKRSKPAPTPPATNPVAKAAVNNPQINPQAAAPAQGQPQAIDPNTGLPDMNLNQIGAQATGQAAGAFNGNQYDLFGTGTQGSAPVNVYLPEQPDEHLPHGLDYSSYTQHRSGVQTTVDQAVATLYNQPPEDLQKIQARLYQAGAYGKAKPTDIAWGHVDSLTRAAYTDIVLEASRRLAAWNAESGNPQPTINSVMQDLINQTDATGGPLGDRANSATNPKQTKHVDLTNPSTARGLAFQAIENAVGRAPTDQQYAAFTAALQAAERGNPQVTNYAYDNSGNIVGETSSGGLDPSTFANEWVQQHLAQESGNYKAATYYYAAALAALGPGGR